MNWCPLWIPCRLRWVFLWPQSLLSVDRFPILCYFDHFIVRRFVIRQMGGMARVDNRNFLHEDKGSSETIHPFSLIKTLEFLPECIRCSICRCRSRIFGTVLSRERGKTSSLYDVLNLNVRLVIFPLFHYNFLLRY